MTQQSESEPAYAKSGLAKSSFPWYLANIDKHLVPETQKLLHDYSGIPLDQQSKHVHMIRDQAWAIRTYPCTGLGVWLTPYISRSPAYSLVLDRLKSGGSFLDIGCHLGGDLRRLVFDGAPSDRLYGVDIVSHWDVGYNLYRDRDRFGCTFFEIDFLSKANLQLEALCGTIDVISISAVLHQWQKDKQTEGAKRLVEFSSGKGAMVIGHQIGNVDAGEATLKGITAFKHNPDSWAELWKQVGDETGTRWASQARLLTWEDLGWDPHDQAWLPSTDRVLSFVVTRVE